jgi:hypothetical protein
MKAFIVLFAILSLLTTPRAGAVTLSSPHNKAFTSVRDTINRSWFNNKTRTYSRKGSFYLQTGMNWAGFGMSDINFVGPGYDFTLEDVLAHDQPYKSSIQYNIHAGYFITEHYSISVGFDHMKYVMDVPQQLRIDGVIEPQVSSPAIQTGQFAGTYDSQPITVTPELVTLEYTDGFNYVSTHLQRFDDIWVSDNGKKSLSIETGLGAGVIVPRADVKLFGVGMNNKLNVAGWVASLKAGLMLNFTKHIYFHGSFEAGHSSMYKIYTTGRNDTDKASQKLNFLQNSYLLGFRF